MLLIVVVIAAGVVLWLRPPRPLVAAVARTPTLRAAAISLAVLLVLSYALNDSGLAIPAIMLALIAFTVTYLVTRDLSSGDVGHEGNADVVGASVPLNSP